MLSFIFSGRSATQMEDLDDMLPLIKELEYINSSKLN